MDTLSQNYYDNLSDTDKQFYDLLEHNCEILTKKYGQLAVGLDDMVLLTFEQIKKLWQWGFVVDDIYNKAVIRKENESK